MVVGVECGIVDPLCLSATVVAFLASDDTRWLTGSLLQAAGGGRLAVTNLM
jgi:hypothetical protein